MSKRIANSVFAALVLMATVLTGPVVCAQVFSTPEQAAIDPDFLVQGEYAGTNKAMQVIARGDGDFEIVVYEGGLPGAGWDKQPPRRVDGDEDVVAQLAESMGLEKIRRKSPTLGASPPPGAIVLFDGSEESLRANWENGAQRTGEGHLMQGVTTRQSFGDYRLHLEFQTPYMPKATGQGRGNSGVYHQGRYETQVLDSFGLQGKDNETGGIYSVSAPSINLCLPPLAWQTYDVEFTAAKFDSDGQKISPARLTVRLNGVVVQSNVAVPGPTTAAIRPETPEPGPLHLQDHGNPVRFRNIWLVPRDIQRESRRPVVAGYERFFAGTGETSPAAGRVLADSLGCAACHYDSRPDDPVAISFGPDLTDVAGRVRHEYLVDWIAAPHPTKPGTVMPDLWAGKTDAQRREFANAIAQFLVSDRPEPLESVGDQAAADRGQNLYHQIGCVACHSPLRRTDGQPIDQAELVSGSVPLGDLAAKYTLESLTKFLADPLAVRAHGRMPKLAADAAEARDLATYLLKDLVVVESKETLRRRVYQGTWDRLPDFESLTAVAESRVSEIEINSIPYKDNFGVVFDGYLDIPAKGQYRFRLASDDGARIIVDGKTVVDHDGIHPATEKAGNVRLEKGVVAVRLEYFEASGEEELRAVVDTPFSGTVALASLVSTEPTGRQPISLVDSRFKSEPSLVDRGRQWFVSVGCAQCHKTGGQSDLRWEKGAGNLATLRTGQGCLADDPSTATSTAGNRRVADYSLTDGQRQALEALLASDRPTLKAEDSIHHRLVSLNCYACHVRDTLGGPEATRRDYFATTTPEMGDEGRLPPILTGVGDKLNDRYLLKVLDQGANQRPYMKTRMPAFGVHATVDLSKWLIEVDRQGLEPEIAIADVADQAAFKHRQSTDGRTLAGNDGLACIKCHTFGGVGLAGIQAIDALLMPERLREDWFHRYLIDPQQYRPGTRMPASFPDGKSVVTKIADGRPSDQAAALWAYFSQGKDAKAPLGLYPNAIELRPTTRPVIYRNFLTGLSPRGIGVGYPQGVNIGWDSQRMMLAKVWKNAFIDASKHWIGRGPGAQEPLGDAVIAIDRATPVARIEPGAAWPVADAIKDSIRFLGYQLDPAGRPVFRYTVDGLIVQDAVSPLESATSDKSLERTFTITGRGVATILVAAGQVEPLETETAESASFQIDNSYRITITGGKVEHTGSADRDELRVTIDLGESESTATVTQQITW